MAVEYRPPMILFRQPSPAAMRRVSPAVRDQRRYSALTFY
jgi:hypothetical protein